MNFDQFKKEWGDMMVYKPSEFDYDETMNDLYIAYKEHCSEMYQCSVREFCEFFHEHCDLDQHPYMLKKKALQTHHGNSLKEIANTWRKNNGVPLIPLIPKP